MIILNRYRGSIYLLPRPTRVMLEPVHILVVLLLLTVSLHVLLISNTISGNWAEILDSSNLLTACTVLLVGVCGAYLVMLIDKDFFKTDVRITEK